MLAWDSSLKHVDNLPMNPNPSGKFQFEQEIWGQKSTDLLGKYIKDMINDSSSTLEY